MGIYLETIFYPTVLHLTKTRQLITLSYWTKALSEKPHATLIAGFLILIEENISYSP